MNAQALFAPGAPSTDGIDLRKLNSSYCADLIAWESKVRKPVPCNGHLWVNVGASWKGDMHSMDVFRLVPSAEFEGETFNYEEKRSLQSSDLDQVDPMGFYHGMRVRHGRDAYVMCGPEVVVTAHEGLTGTLDDRSADDELDDVDQLECSECGVALAGLDHHFVLPCGMMCPACAEAHAPSCSECSEEWDEPEVAYTLPGMDHVAEERAEAAAEALGDDLTRQLLIAQPSISKRSGEMETHSPLFRESPANAQLSLF